MNKLISTGSILCSAVFAIAAAACGGTNADGTAAQPLAASTPSEQTAAAPATNTPDARFERHFDRNNNGTVEVAELPARMQARVAAADTDRDGVIAPAEMTAFRQTQRVARFARLDKDSNGAINAEEAGEKWGRISRADADNNGSVTQAEMDTAMAARRGGFHGGGPGMRGGHGFGHGMMRGGNPALFLQRFDRDGNGTVQVAELPEGMQARLGAADTDHDGTLAASEMTAFAETRRAAHFARIDSNSDGAITAEEAGERWVHVSRADADHDGRVSRAELDQARSSGAMRGGHQGMHHGAETIDRNAAQKR